jgi:hypothetical protein
MSAVLLSCDTCGLRFSDPEEGDGFATVTQARQLAGNSGWRVGVRTPGIRGPRDFCPRHGGAS